MSVKLLMNVAALTLAVALATPLAAQGRGRNTNGVPPGQRPPPGLCRVWIAGVPPGQQPGVTDCVTARASVPANGRVLYGGRPTRRYTTDNNPYYYGVTTRDNDNDDDDRGKSGKGKGHGHGHGKNK